MKRIFDYGSNRNPFYLVLRRVAVENTNQNIEENTTQEVEQNEVQVTEQDVMNTEPETLNADAQPKKRFSPAALIVPIAVVVILAAFAGIIYYGKVVKPNKEVDKVAGYTVEDYIVMDKYTGFDYEITQALFDECVREETDSYEEVNRPIIAPDQVEFHVTGYVDGTETADISSKNAVIDIGTYSEGINKIFSDAMLGKKKGDKMNLDVAGVLANEVSESKANYAGKSVSFELKVVGINKLVREEVTDKWVKENYYDEYGLENKKDFYNWCKDIVLENATVEVWQLAVDSATMAGYPQELYDDIVLEFTQDANYYAEEFGMKTEDYLKDFCGYTDESLEEEYLNEVKSELVMWYIVKDQRLECTDKDIEAKYEELYLDIGYDTVDEMKADYTKKEIKKAVLLEKAQAYVYEHSNIAENFAIPK